NSHYPSSFSHLDVLRTVTDITSAVRVTAQLAHCSVQTFGVGFFVRHLFVANDNFKHSTEAEPVDFSSQSRMTSAADNSKPITFAMQMLNRGVGAINQRRGLFAVMAEPQLISLVPLLRRQPHSFVK